MDLIITILPVVTKDLPISPRFTPYNFLSRCKFSTLTTRQPMVESYSRSHAFRYERTNTNPTFGKNRTHDFRTSRYAGYLLDHSGDELYYMITYMVGKIAPNRSPLAISWLVEGLFAYRALPKRGKKIQHLLPLPLPIHSLNDSDDDPHSAASSTNRSGCRNVGNRVIA